MGLDELAGCIEQLKARMQLSTAAIVGQVIAERFGVHLSRSLVLQAADSDGHQGPATAVASL